MLGSDYPRPREKHMLIKLRQMQDAISLSNKEVNKLVTPLLSLGDLLNFYDDNPISLRHIRGDSNPSDALTKPLRP